MITEHPKFMRWLSDELIKISPKLPFKKSHLVGELLAYNKHRFKYEDTRIPAGTTLALASTWMVHAFKVEDLGDLRQGIEKLFDAHSRSRYIGMWRSPEAIANAFNDVQKNISSRGWTNLGFIEPNYKRETSLLPFVDMIDFQLYSCFQNLALLVIRIQPSKEFHDEFMKISNKHCGESMVFNWKSFLPNTRPTWRSSQIRASQVKEELFDALLSDLRNQVSCYLNRYFCDYFSRNQFSAPSFELYLFDEPPAPIQQAVLPTERLRPSFWASTGMEKNRNAFSDTGKTTFFFAPFLNQINVSENKAIKILVERKSVVMNSGHQSVESQIISQVSDWVIGLSPVWALQNILFCIQKRLPGYRDAIFSYAHSWQANWWPFLSKIALDKLKLNTDWFTFERLRRDFRLRDIQLGMKYRGIPAFTWTLGSGSKAWSQELSREMINSVRAHLNETRKVFTTINFAFNEMLQVNTLRSNFWLQVIMFGVAVAALIVSAVTLHVTKSGEIIPHKIDYVVHNEGNADRASGNYVNKMHSEDSGRALRSHN